MLVQQGLGLRLSREPVLTQSLHQWVKLLALNKLELKAEINQELSENPLLEASEDSEDDPEGDDAPLDSSGVSDSAHESGGSETGDEPTGDVSDDPFSEIDLGSFFDEYRESVGRLSLDAIAERPSLEAFLSEPLTLGSHLKRQLSMSHGSEAVQAAAKAVLGNLNEDGYLTASLEELRESVGVSLDDARAALELVQTFDPPGVAARDLRECLLIQLRDCEPENGIATTMVKGFLPELGNNNFTAIAYKTGWPLEEVERGVALIRTLDPRPGQRYAQSENPHVEPDVYFVKTRDGFRVVLDEENLPRLRLNRGYRRLLERGNASTDVRNYVRERYHSAIQLLRNIEQRRQTILSVCESIAERQRDFLSYGVRCLRPMMIREVAEEIGIHPSTVSRAVAGKYAHTEHGVHQLRFFFSQAVQGPRGTSMPLMLLKLKVKEMIEQEDVARPLTDDHISKALSQDGISVTRRTVAKYRGEMNIPSTHRRRKKLRGDGR